MLLIDDILFAPFRGLLWISQEIHGMAESEIEQRREDIIAQLSDLYMMLERGQMSEAVFDEKEAELLTLLEQYDADE